MASKDKGKAKKTTGQPDELSDAPSWTDGIPLSPSWWAPVFIALGIIGLLYLVVFYFSSGQFPIPGIGNWNILIGVGIMLCGFAMVLRWR